MPYHGLTDEQATVLDHLFDEYERYARTGTGDRAAKRRAIYATIVFLLRENRQEVTTRAALDAWLDADAYADANGIAVADRQDEVYALGAALARTTQRTLNGLHPDPRPWRQARS